MVPYNVYRGLPEMVGQLVQQDLAQIGVRIELRTSSVPSFYAITRRRGKAAMSPQGWAEDFPDPSDFLEPLFTRASIADENATNSAFWSNERLESLLAKARESIDPRERARLYEDAERVVCDEAPWAFEYAYRFFHVHQPYVRDYRTHPVWATDVNRVWIDRDARARPATPLGSVLP